MSDLTDHGHRAIGDLAARYGLSQATAEQMARAVANSGGVCRLTLRQARDLRQADRWNLRPPFEGGVINRNARCRNNLLIWRSLFPSAGPIHFGGTPVLKSCGSKGARVGHIIAIHSSSSQGVLSGNGKRLSGFEQI